MSGRAPGLLTFSSRAWSWLSWPPYRRPRAEARPSEGLGSLAVILWRQTGGGPMDSSAAREDEDPERGRPRRRRGSSKRNGTQTTGKRIAASAGVHDTIRR